MVFLRYLSSTRCNSKLKGAFCQSAQRFLASQSRDTHSCHRVVDSHDAPHTSARCSLEHTRNCIPCFGTFPPTPNKFLRTVGLQVPPC